MTNGIFNRRFLLAGVAIAALTGCQCAPQDQSFTPSAYATPDQAVAALVTASRKEDRQELLQILGPQAEKLVYSGDPVADREGQQSFVAAYDAYHRLDAEGTDKDILVVGAEEWPMPIPLIHTEAGWIFDVEAGAQVILDRRIGRDELDVIEICRAYVDAQREYAVQFKQTYGYRAYAQHIDSAPGTHDGLYWPAAPDQPQSPFGPLMADAQAEGYDKIAGRHAPYHGYYFRVLNRQGPAAAGGEKNYVVNGHMTRGFALIAYPATYGNSGIKSFIVNQNGIIYEKDLGPDTENAAAQIRAYNPDEDWQMVR